MTVVNDPRVPGTWMPSYRPQGRGPFGRGGGPLNINNLRARGGWGGARQAGQQQRAKGGSGMPGDPFVLGSQDQARIAEGMRTGGINPGAGTGGWNMGQQPPSNYGGGFSGQASAFNQQMMQQQQQPMQQPQIGGQFAHQPPAMAGLGAVGSGAPGNIDDMTASMQGQVSARNAAMSNAGNQIDPARQEAFRARQAGISGSGFAPNMGESAYTPPSGPIGGAPGGGVWGGAGQAGQQPYRGGPQGSRNPWMNRPQQAPQSTFNDPRRMARDPRLQRGMHPSQGGMSPYRNALMMGSRRPAWLPQSRGYRTGPSYMQGQGPRYAPPTMGAKPYGIPGRMY